MRVGRCQSLRLFATAALLATVVVGCSGSPAPGASAGSSASATARPTASFTVIPAPAPTTTPSAGASAIPAPVPIASAAPAVDAHSLSITDPLSFRVMVNKLRPLQPVSHVPPDLIDAKVAHISRPLMRAEAAHALERMFAAGAAEGSGALQVQNSYRSYTTQVSTYGYHVRTVGKNAADTKSARPGYSEHQTGHAVDIAALPSRCDIEECFGSTPHGIWLAANSWRFGFVLSYPAGKTSLTGYIYEPWHFRYVGPVLAEKLRASGLSTLGEYFDLPPAPTYAD